MAGLRIAMIGTRGVPAAYGGFETAVEEIGSRLVTRGHRVLVYSRNISGAAYEGRHYKGMRTFTLPALHRKSAETLSHTGLSVAHSIAVARPDVAIVFNAANAPFLPPLRAAGIPVATHVDGLEWRRAKWGPTGKKYYLWAERRAVQWSDALIADAAGISDYYRRTYDADTEQIAYGAPILDGAGADLLPGWVHPREYHLVVARFEPENHVLEIIKGFSQSSARYPLIVVGSAPFAEQYTAQIADIASNDPRIRLVGRVDDQAELDQLYANAMTYLHGHSVGGTNPSLLRAMGAGVQILAFDVDFNREVAGGLARFWSVPDDIPSLLKEAEANPEETIAAGEAARERAAERYQWDDVTDRYEDLARRLARKTS
jgi:glycosyltransferase involved in cell wall biosynthesis